MNEYMHANILTNDERILLSYLIGVFRRTKEYFILQRRSALWWEETGAGWSPKIIRSLQEVPTYIRGGKTRERNLNSQGPQWLLPCATKIANQPRRDKPLKTCVFNTILNYNSLNKIWFNSLLHVWTARSPLGCLYSLAVWRFMVLVQTYLVKTKCPVVPGSPAMKWDQLSRRAHFCRPVRSGRRPFLRYLSLSNNLWSELSWSEPLFALGLGLNEQC